MRFLRTLPLLGIMLILSGCFRQAEETFDTVGSQNSDATTLTQELPTEVPSATSEITFIDPNATETPNSSDATATPRIISPTDSSLPTSTTRAIPTATQAVASATPLVVPTATGVGFVTPGFNEENVQPTATATEIIIQSTLEATPTAIGGEVVVGDCEYEIQNGDNLFRIALNNDVALSALLSANGLTEASIIQPGQILTLPNCDGASALTVDEEADLIPTAIVLDDCEYEIQDGDTLFGIAIENSVTLAALLEENELTEADAATIQPGDILTIPNCEDGDDESSVSPIEILPEATDEAPQQTIHTVVAGDTLLSVARLYGVTPNSIAQINTIPNPNNLTVGQQLVIPIGQ